MVEQGPMMLSDEETMKTTLALYVRHVILWVSFDLWFILWYLWFSPGCSFPPYWMPRTKWRLIGEQPPYDGSLEGTYNKELEYVIIRHHLEGNHSV